MIILHNHQLQNQCFRPSSHHRHFSNTPIQPEPIPSHPLHLHQGDTMRKSYSSASPAYKKENNYQQDRPKFQLSNWMANHLLSDVKEKFKNIIKQKNHKDDPKRPSASPRKNSTHNGRKLNFSVNCEPAAITDKKMLNRSHIQKSGKSKKLIDLKRGRLYKGTHRDYNQFIRNQINCENLNTPHHPAPQIDDLPSDEDLEESYLRSQYAILQRRREEKEEDRVKTEKRTIEPTHYFEMAKYQSEILSSSQKRHSPILRRDSSHTPSKLSEKEERPLINLNQDDFMFLKRSSLTRRQQRKRHHNRSFKSKVSLQLYSQT